MSEWKFNQETVDALMAFPGEYRRQQIEREAKQPQPAQPATPRQGMPAKSKATREDRE